MKHISVSVSVSVSDSDRDANTQDAGSLALNRKARRAETARSKRPAVARCACCHPDNTPVHEDTLLATAKVNGAP